MRRAASPVLAAAAAVALFGTGCASTLEVPFHVEAKDLRLGEIRGAQVFVGAEPIAEKTTPCEFTVVFADEMEEKRITVSHPGFRPPLPRPVRAGDARRILFLLEDR